MHQQSPALLAIRDLHLNVAENPVLRGLDLTLEPGSIHAIMGPNGSGKSSLAYCLARKPGYTPHAGSMHFLGQDLSTLTPEACGVQGLFVGFQYPVAIPGLSNVQFLRAALNAARRARSEPPLDALDCLKRIKEQLQILEIPETWLSRGLNEGFSGGEKKRNELLQWALLKPKLAIFDEMDSGLDIDALKSIAQAIHRLRAPDQSLLLITHYPRLLELVRPDRVHVLIAGKIVQSGDQQLACDLERSGYAAYSEIPARAL